MLVLAFFLWGLHCFSLARSMKSFWYQARTTYDGWCCRHSLPNNLMFGCHAFLGSKSCTNPFSLRNQCFQHFQNILKERQTATSTDLIAGWPPCCRRTPCTRSCIAGDSLQMKQWSGEVFKWPMGAKCCNSMGSTRCARKFEIEDAQSWLRRCRGYRPDTAWSMGSDRSMGRQIGCSMIQQCFTRRTCPCLSKHKKGKTGRTSWTQMLWVLFVFGNRQFAADPFVRTALCAELRWHVLAGRGWLECVRTC